MKVVLLAGGMGTRLAEYTEARPKPMVEVGGRPILWYLMKHYAHYGFAEFVLALGYKGDVIKRYFLDYHGLSKSMTVSLRDGHVTPIGDAQAEDWNVHLVDTGLETMTGGRVKRLESVLGNETFMLTYGDGLSDVDLGKLLAFHKSHGKIATVTAVRPPARFGGLVFDGDRVSEFTEKPQIGEGWINGGFMVFEPKLFSYLKGDETVLEKDALEEIASDGQLMAYRHGNFWQCMDTVRDLKVLEGLWSSKDPPWKSWA
jgi:glucose-1-phosphate cytidylyltransferase